MVLKVNLKVQKSINFFILHYFKVVFLLSMLTRFDVQTFLENFHLKMGIWGIVIRDDRGKNTQTLLDLEISKAQRNQALMSLAPEDYSEGPMKDRLHHGADMWVFGKTIKSLEIYIKITMGVPDAQVICISFHLAEHKMTYPFR